MIELYKGDCLELMKSIPDKSVDMVLCDLPYGVLNRKSEGGTWDFIIPFEPLWEQYRRVTKSNSAIVLFCQGIFTAKLMMSQPKMWRYNLVWDKVLKNGFLNANRMPLRQHEDIAVFYDKLPIYNPQMTRCEPHKRNHSKENGLHRDINRCYGSYIETPTIISDEKFPTSILSFPKQHITGKSYHPTEKPVALLEYLIKTYTNPGQLVLDNTMGSGSTGVACVNTGRDFIGIELDDKYFSIAQKRIQQAEIDKAEMLF